MARIANVTIFTLPDYTKVIREFGFTKYEPRGGVICFEPASGYTLRLCMKVVAFMGDATIITQWTLTQGGVVVESGSEPATLLSRLIKTAIPPYTQELEKKVSECFGNCIRTLKANSGNHEIAVSTMGQGVTVIVAIGPERCASVKQLLIDNEIPYPA